MSNVMRLPLFSKTVLEADIPMSQRDEFERAIIEFVAKSSPCAPVDRSSPTVVWNEIQS